MWLLALVHGVLSGTDSRSPFAIALYATSGALVGAAAWHRWAGRPRQLPARELPARQLPARRPLAVQIARTEESS